MEAQGSAIVGSGSVIGARLRVAQSRSGGAGCWLVQAGGVVVVTARVSQGFAMGGRK